MSKTPSSAGRFERRSVRFCPVSTVIAATTTVADDREYNEGKRDDRWREKATARGNSTLKNDEFKVQISEKQRRVEEVAKELLKNYHHGRIYQNDESNKCKNRRFEDEDEDDASCCSSDLFELEHLLEVGSDHHRRYREELPVYETTHVHTNRAIANGECLVTGYSDSDYAADVDTRRECLVTGYSDSDYAADVDTRRSVTGYVFTLGGSVVTRTS
uniref:Uncharacterized protein n=1 Tax=Chenopodium quinoa TaxID=63459 RepID=A0A803KR41_CHEQI